MNKKFVKLRKKIALLMAPLALGVGVGSRGIEAKNVGSKVVSKSSKNKVDSKNVSLNGYGGTIGALVGLTGAIVHNALLVNDKLPDKYKNAFGGSLSSILSSFGAPALVALGAVVGEAISNARRPSLSDLVESKSEDEESKKAEETKSRSVELAKQYMSISSAVERALGSNSIPREAKREIKQKLRAIKNAVMFDHPEVISTCNRLVDSYGLSDASVYSKEMLSKAQKELTSYVRMSISSSEADKLNPSLENACKSCLLLIDEIKSKVGATSENQNKGETPAQVTNNDNGTQGVAQSR